MGHFSSRPRAQRSWQKVVQKKGAPGVPEPEQPADGDRHRLVAPIAPAFGRLRCQP